MSPIAGRDGAPLIFLVAGEPSGDAIGARLMAALKRQTVGRIQFAGVGGERMASEGLESLFPIGELAVMGILEVLPHIRNILRRIRETARAAEALRPAAIVTIDSPSFTLEVSQRLKGKGMRLIHYVAPSVWAWKPWRAKQMARYLDHLLTLLPFEPPYFEKHGLATTFVGYPAVEVAAEAGDAEVFRDKYGIPREAPILCVLPGSRRGEVKRLLPVFAKTVSRLRGDFPALHAVVPTVATVAETVARSTADWPVPVAVVRDADDKASAFAAARAALAASGTVAVELAAAGCPAVIAYRMNSATALLALLLVRVDFASPVNLVLGRAAQPEFIQLNCTPRKLAAAVGSLLGNSPTRQAQLADCREAIRRLGGDGETPSTRAARAVLGVIGASAKAENSYDGEKMEEGA